MAFILVVYVPGHNHPVARHVLLGSLKIPLHLGRVSLGACVHLVRLLKFVKAVPLTGSVPVVLLVRIQIPPMLLVAPVSRDANLGNLSLLHLLVFQINGVQRATLGLFP